MGVSHDLIEEKCRGYSKKIHGKKIFALSTITYLCLGEVIRGLSQNGMQKVHRTESACNERKDVMTPNIDLRRNTCMWENIPVSKLTEGELTIVRVCSEVFHTVKPLTQT